MSVAGQCRNCRWFESYALHASAVMSKSNAATLGYGVCGLMRKPHNPSIPIFPNQAIILAPDDPLANVGVGPDFGCVMFQPFPGESSDPR